MSGVLHTGCVQFPVGQRGCGLNFAVVAIQMSEGHTIAPGVQRRPAARASFYLPERQALRGMDPLSLDADTHWFVFGTGVYVWILQTFVRLRAAGAPVELVDTPPDSGLLVVHADHFQQAFARAVSPGKLTFVVARSDRDPQPLADFAIVQNAAAADRSQFFIPSWVQPGLIPRNRSRGSVVANVSYFGSIKELDPDLAGDGWVDALRDRGITWDPRTITFVGNDRLYETARWHDYSTTDVVVALRPATGSGRSKPAAKLQNAWAAGVPAVLSPEAAYREVRRSALDYLEARSSAEALAAIDRLQQNPGLYADMDQSGLERAREFHPERLVERWQQVLWDEIPTQARRPAHRLFVRARRWRAMIRRSTGAITRVGAACRA